MKVIVVGGGLSGLAFAHALEKDTGDRAEITLLEEGAALGGTVQTSRVDDFVLESGADGWLASKPQATKLARDVGLGGELIETIAENRRVFVVWNDRLVPVPPGMILAVPTDPSAVDASSLFSAEGKARIAREPEIPARAWSDDDDESIADFMTRRFGEELTERLGAPLLGGIVSGEAADLSIRATFPQLVDAEKAHGSLTRGMRELVRSRADPSPDAVPASAFLSLRGGMGAFANAIAKSLTRTQIRANVAVTSVTSDASDARGRYAVTLASGETLHADALVAAIPFGRAASILAPIDPAIARALAAFDEVTATVALLAFRRRQIEHPLDATGFLLPRVSGRPLVASTFMTSKWPDRASSDHVLLRGFVRSVGDVDLAALDDEEVARIADAELRRVIRITGRPLFYRVSRIRRPHLRVGHLARVRDLRAALSKHPALHLLASGLDGVGIPDCVRLAQEAAASMLTSS